MRFGARAKEGGGHTGNLKVASLYREGGAATISCRKRAGNTPGTSRSPAAIGRRGLLLFLAEGEEGVRRSTGL